MKNVLEMTYKQLCQAVAAAGQPAYRADQIADWIYRKGVTDPARMTNLPPALAGELVIMTSRVVERFDSSDGTIKLLLELHDGERIETVMIPAEGRCTACLSTQVGCGMACGFCASGLAGVVRNLSCGEMLQQILHLRQAAGQRITHVVFMGVGEPLANYRATVDAIRAIVDPNLFNISARHVTVSTVGLPKAIRRLADEDLPITLAISLHAPNDALRRKLIPAAAKAPLESIIAAAEQFYAARKRELTLEYVLIAGVNDTKVCAEGLANIARRLRCNVNLIRYNPVPGLPYERPSQLATQDFARRLEKRGVNVQIRRPRGLDASAACGQLRRTTTEDRADTEDSQGQLQPDSVAEENRQP